MPNLHPHSSNERDNIALALSKITAQGKSYMSNEPGAREKLIASARDLIDAAESPIESLLWLIWAEPARSTAARIAVDLKLFATVTEDEGRPKTVADLAAATGASYKLVARIARLCASMRMLDEQSEGVYIPNRLSGILAQPDKAAGIVFCYDFTHPSFAKLPEFLKSINLHNPEDNRNGPFQYANQVENPFDWLTEHPHVFQAFHQYIHTIRILRPSWIEMYPVQENLIQGVKLEGDSSVLVDIGGSVGTVLEDFRVRVPLYTGRLVLQELPGVIAAAKSMGLNSRIEPQVHDFLTPQPIKGARAYFMRSILHDWPDETCRTILGHLKDVMEPGYSRILINECVVANEQAAWQHASLDLYMMALGSSQERTEHEWRTLVESCGLKIAGIYSKGQGNESLIEVVI